MNTVRVRQLGWLCAMLDLLDKDTGKMKQKITLKEEFEKAYLFAYENHCNNSRRAVLHATMCLAETMGDYINEGTDAEGIDFNAIYNDLANEFYA